MKRWALGLGFAIAALLLLFIAAGVLLRYMVPGSIKETVAARLSTSLGVPVTVGTAHFDLWSWMRLQPAISLQNASIGNPPGFGSGHLLEAKRIAARVELLPLLRRDIRVRSISIDEPRVAVEKDAGGETNIEAFLKNLSAGGTGGPPGTPAEESGTEVAVAQLELNGGEVTAPGVKLSGIRLRASDLGAGRRSRIELAAKLFGGPQSGFTLAGTAGPFGKDALPLEASLALQIAPAEIPPRLRSEHFGAWLKSPGGKALAKLDATVKGDVYGTVAGPARLVLSDLSVGRDEKHLLRLAADAPATFSAAQLMSQPRIDLRLPKAEVKLGSGTWDGAAELHLRGSTLSGATRGAIRDVDINDVLTAFTSAGGKVYGVLTVPSYSLQFAGRDAAELRQSLSGAGKLEIGKGRLAALDMLASIEQALKGAGGGETGAKGTTPFTSLAAELSVGRGRLDFSTIALDSPALRCAGKGTIGFDQAMHFDLDAQVTGGAARLVNTLARRGSGELASVPLVVAGAVDSPRVRPNVRKLAGGMAEGLIQSLFGKKK